jgi:hypothetical protein
MAASVYRLPDEPRPSGLSRYAVDPMWPMLALMLAGNALGLAWFAFNSAALGSPTRGREWLCIGASLATTVALLFLLGALRHSGALDPLALRYAFLSVITAKLAFGYVLYLMQQRCFELWEHYGGQARKGVILLIPLTLFSHRALNGEGWPPLLQALVQ